MTGGVGRCGHCGRRLLVVTTTGDDRVTIEYRGMRGQSTGGRWKNAPANMTRTVPTEALRSGEVFELTDLDGSPALVVPCYRCGKPSALPLTVLF